MDNGNKFDVEEFFKNSFDSSLRYLLETRFFYTFSQWHSSPFLVTGKLTLGFKLNKGLNKYYLRNTTRNWEFREFNFDPEEYKDQVQIENHEIIDYCTAKADECIAGFLNSSRFIDLSYLRIKNVLVFRDAVVDNLAFDDFKNNFYITIDFDLFLMVRLLLSGSADYFLNGLKEGFIQWFPVLHQFNSYKYTFVNEKLVPSPSASFENDSGRGPQLPWCSSNDWRTHFLHFYVPEKLIPVKDFIGTNRINISVDDFINDYYKLIDLRLTALTEDDLSINTKYLTQGWYTGLRQLTREPENDESEVRRSEQVTGFCEPRYLIRGFYDHEFFSAGMLINLMKYYLYFSGTAFKISTRSTFSFMSFKEFVKARIIKSTKDIMQLTVYEGGTAKGPFKVCRLVPYVQMKGVLLDIVEEVRNWFPIRFPFLIKSHDLNQLIAEYSDEAIKLIMSNPKDYVWCIEMD